MLGKAGADRIVLHLFEGPGRQVGGVQPIQAGHGRPVGWRRLPPNNDATAATIKPWLRQLVRHNQTRTPDCVRTGTIMAGTLETALYTVTQVLYSN